MEGRRPRMSSDTKWIVGTMIVLGGLLSAQISLVNVRIDDLGASVNARIDDLEASLNARMDGLEGRMDGLEGRIDSFDERLRNIEIAFGRVDQRLLTLERVLLPPQNPDQ